MKEEKKNVKNSGSESLLYSLFRRLVHAKENGGTETAETILNIKEKKDVPGQETPHTDTAYDTRDFLDTPADSELLSYRMKWKGKGQGDKDASLRSFVYDDLDIPREDTVNWMKEASKLAGMRLEERHRRLDAEVLIMTAGDRLSAWCFVLPAINGGVPVSAESLRTKLSERGIISGIQNDRVEMAPQEDFGMKWIRVAKGIPPKHGTDGTLTENYSHTAGIPQFIEDEKGNVDFHELNWLIKISKGDEICTFVHATKGENGQNVFGSEVKARNGREPLIPAGKNTKVDEENGRVVSTADGQLSYHRGRFDVSELLEIHGDIGTATGNIDSQCDVLIHGSIRSGYNVTSLGSIIVNGMVERSTVIAGRDVYISYGMAGGGTGTLDVGGTVRCKYLENVNVRVTGDVITESIVNSQVDCDGSILANIGRGAVVGGRLLAMNRIEAKIIGNKVHGHTVLLIAPSPHFQEIKMQLGIEYANAGRESEAQDTKKKERAEKLKKLIEELDERENMTKNGQIIAGIIYPVTEVSFQGFSRTIESEENAIRLFRDSDGIKTGMM